MSGNKIFCYKTDKKREIIALLYEQEIDIWHKRVHKNKGTREENIEDTLKSVADDSFFVVEVNGEVAAFFSIYPNDAVAVLNGFHVHKKYRSNIFFSVYWEIIKSFFNDEIFCSLSVANQAAIDHLKKQGFVEFKTITEKQTDFIILYLKL